MASVEQVKAFWESNPLFSGESRHAIGSREFFEEHREVTIGDCMAGVFDSRFLPPGSNRSAVLDLGCGPGFWTIELARRANLSGRIVAADLTTQAAALTGKRAEIYGIDVATEVQNAERLTFPDGRFSHVNCIGVIHHTPDTAACVREIARVLRPGGTAVVSVYYKNIILRNWSLLSGIGRLLAQAGAMLRGRGREDIFRQNDIEEIVRLYDGAENPVGKAYTKAEYYALLEPYFVINDSFLIFFPARSLPFKIPKWLHRWLDRNVGFLITTTLTKR